MTNNAVLCMLFTSLAVITVTRVWKAWLILIVHHIKIRFWNSVLKYSCVVPAFLHCFLTKRCATVSKDNYLLDLVNMALPLKSIRSNYIVSRFEAKLVWEWRKSDLIFIPSKTFIFNQINQARGVFLNSPFKKGVLILRPYFTVFSTIRDDNVFVVFVFVFWSQVMKWVVWIK